MARRARTRISTPVSFDFNNFLVTFVSIIFEAMPFIVIGAIISGALEELLPQQFFNRFLPKSRFLAIVLSSLLGFVLPMCECGIVAVMRRLLGKGVPVSCAIAYMFSAPIINPIVLSSTSLAFWNTYDIQLRLPGMAPILLPGMGMVLMRAGGAFLIAVTVGLVMDRLDKRGVKLVNLDVSRLRIVESEESSRLKEEDLESKPGHGEPGHVHGPNCDHDHSHDHEHHHDHSHDGHDHDHDHGHAHNHGPARRTLLDRLKGIADIALGDFIDITSFLVIGAAFAATVNTAFPRERLDELSSNRPLSIIAMMAFAFLVTLCSEADAFVAANFVTLGTGAKLSFLVLGPMLDIKLLIMFRWVFTKKAMWTFIPILVGMSYLIGQSADLLELAGITFKQTVAGMQRG